jgi:beta-lactamase regulating signal transducer with metallopeptidase domain
MNELWTGAARWLVHTAVGGGLLLLLTCILMRWIRQPARRQRLGECGLVAALLVAVLSLIGPSWLVVAWNAGAAPQQSADEANAAPPAPKRDRADFLLIPPLPGHVAISSSKPDAALQAGDSRAPGLADSLLPQPASTTWMDTTVAFALALFALAAGCFAGRLTLGYLALSHLLQHSEKAPPEVYGLFEAMAAGTRWVRLLVSRRLLVPLSCGLMRPTVVLPAGMCAQPTPRQLRWIFAHELTHLRRRDAWTALLFGLGQVLFFFVPWFWWLRRQVRLCQEYVADAAATAGHDGEAVPYAEFLVSLANAPAVPAGAAAVSGNSSDLTRRVTMLLNDPLRIDTRCSRRWTLAVAGTLLSLAVLVAGLGYRAEAAADDPIVIVLRPDSAKAAGDKQRIRVFVGPAGPGKAGVDDHVIVWRYTEPERTGPTGYIQEHAAKAAAADTIVIEQVGPVEGRWAYAFQQTDNLDPLRDALKHLEKLHEYGKLSKERIRAEIAKALAAMKAHAVDPTLEAVVRCYLAEKGVREQTGKDVELIIEKQKPQGKVLKFHKDERYDTVIKSLELLHKQGKEAESGNWKFEFIPVDGQDKKTPQKVETVEQLQKLLGELEASRKIKGKLAEYYQALGRDKAALYLWTTGGGPKDKAAVKPRLGVSVESLDPVLTEHLNLPANVGILVVEVFAQSPAEKAGIKVNDLLLKIDGAMVPSNVEDFVKLIAALKSDLPFEVVVLRKGQKQSIGTVKLADGKSLADPRARWNINEHLPDTIDMKAIHEWVHGAKKSDDKDAVTTTVTRRGDTFSVKHQEGSSSITLNATLKDGSLQVDGISVHNDKGVQNYKTLNDAPEQVRNRVRQILEMLARNTAAKEAK